MKNSLQLGTVAGIKISIHWTFMILLIWIVFINWKSGQDAMAILWSLFFILAIFGCVILHELGHALTAKRFHINTRDITLYPIGGIARLDSIPKKPKEELLVALAGPAVNLLIAALLLPFIDLALLQNPENLITIGKGNFILMFTTVNVWLALFNLIPAFPMDGGRVFRAILGFRMNRAKATKIAATLGQFFALGFILLGFYINPFLVIIGLFILFGAQAESNFAQTEELIQGQTLLDMTMRENPTLNINATVGEAVDQVLNSQIKNFVIRDNGNVVGILSQSQIIKAVKEHGESIWVSKVMDKEILYLPASLSVEESIQKLQRANKSAAVVLHDNKFIGLIDNDNLLEFISILAARSEYAKAHS